MLLLLHFLSFAAIFVPLMSFHMLRQVIRSRKGLVAVGESACKRSFKSMYAHMAFQMLQALESSLALGYRADMGLLLSTGRVGTG